MELKFVKGLSDKRISDLNKMGITSAEDLVRHFPRTYLDLRKAVKLCEAMHNDFALIKGRIVGKPTLNKTKGRLTVVKALCEQDGELFNIVWFNQPYVCSKLVTDETYLFYGRVRNRFGQVSVTNPTFDVLDEKTSLKGIIPVYSVKGCLTQKIMRNVIQDALTKLKFVSFLPKSAYAQNAELSLADAYKMVHNPNSFDERDSASERIALEEYFILITAFRIIKGDKQQARINRYTVGGTEINEFSKRFGFEFTNGQKQAVNDIYTDLSGTRVMNRLVQGDVGSGKTAVSMCALYIALKSGYQAVMISPTEVLAKQNYEIISKFLPEFDAIFLSGSLSAKEKNNAKQLIANGSAKVVCGTHAVLQNDVVFNNLSLCVCDEQHRFGVSQRSSLVAKGSSCDVLVMSATPIPRTLSLIFYGDLDISTISDKPKQRIEIKTSVVPSNKYADMLQFIKKQVDSGRQAFFVCPKIEGDTEGSVMSVKEIFDELSSKLPSLRIAMLHGKMKDAEKTEIMLDFKARKFDALVSTTVIEVGVDVPNATIMTIFGADRFGLSQLHQLRGRVGRSDLESYCFLLSDNENEKTVERLKTIKNNTDGFAISEADFKERGAGDMLGIKQSGKSNIGLGALKFSTATIFMAKKLSDQVFETRENFDVLKKQALLRYDALKDVTLN